MSNNRANRSLQDLQTQSQRKKLGAHAPHISRGAISQYNTHSTKHTTSASRSQYKRNNTQGQHTAATKHAQTKTPPKGSPPQKRRAQNRGREASKAGGAKSQKGNSAKTGGQIRLARKCWARDPIAPNSRQKSTSKRGQCLAQNLFLFNTYKKNTKYFFILLYILAKIGGFLLCRYGFLRNIRKIYAKYAKK